MRFASFLIWMSDNLILDAGILWRRAQGARQTAKNEVIFVIKLGIKIFSRR